MNALNHHEPSTYMDCFTNIGPMVLHPVIRYDGEISALPNVKKKNHVQHLLYQVWEVPKLGKGPWRSKEEQIACATPSSCPGTCPVMFVGA